MLSPVRNIPANIGINMGGAWYSDGLDISSQAGAAFGGAFGGAFGKYVPMVMGKYISNSVPGFIYDVGGSVTFEYKNEFVKDTINQKGLKNEK